MAEFAKVMKERKRMCSSFINCGAGCPLNKIIGQGSTCWECISKHPEKAEQIIMRWAAEHPEPDPAFEKLKTILDGCDTDRNSILHKVVKWYAKEEENEVRS